ncbi:dTDP-4-dehydrorhamnose 3,5-epimerase family protein, partial [Vibrio cholerae]|nr:dTDP-4-dehydrorhamnose 3,5-epimerase family protein [Vibrio cholerae]HBK7236116.1 dTDP-4-dehydrorhamnose 3,5-epimerase family protein [Vibrio cholerae]HBK7239715.1 dTDP-4-dehydrorhamnose 3,5-epimerase family protein [Vibrio cholerae]
PKAEHSLLWNDPSINIEWPSSEGLLLSDKDKEGLRFSESPKL